MIEAAMGLLFVVLGLVIVARLWKSQSRAAARMTSAPDRSVFSAMDLAPAASHHFQARTTKPAETFRSFAAEQEVEKPGAVLAPTGIRSSPPFRESSPRLIEDLDRSAALPRLPLGAEDSEDPKQESLGF